MDFLSIIVGISDVGELDKSGVYNTLYAIVSRGIYSDYSVRMQQDKAGLKTDSILS